jgi:hypothetical protein
VPGMRISREQYSPIWARVPTTHVQSRRSRPCRHLALTFERPL